MRDAKALGLTVPFSLLARAVRLLADTVEKLDFLS